MRVLLITQWYKPIKGAVKRMARMADHLAETGHEVTVLTGFPSKPTGILPPQYRFKLWAHETDGKVKVLRTYEFPTPNEGVIKRLLNYFSFMVSASIATLLLPRYDAVVVSSPSFFAGIPGLIASTIYQAKFYFDVRDLWPDSAIDMGMAKKGSFVVKVMEFFEKIYYRKATKITTATPAIRTHIINEGLSEKKVSLLLNSTNTNFFKPQKIDRRPYGFGEGDFIACYTGSLSAIQDLDTIVEAANILKKQTKIKFLLVGEGEEKEKLIQKAKRLKLGSCVFLPQQDPAEVVRLINLSDIGIVPILNTKIFQEAIPSKSCEYFACGKPVIASTTGELKRIIEENQVGQVYRGGDAPDAARAVLTLFKDHEFTKKSLNARGLAMKTFSDQIFYRKFDQVLEIVSAKPRNSPKRLEYKRKLKDKSRKSALE
jgi:colanic acid biosynthesis glycosyl transferase WcaI